MEVVVMDDVILNGKIFSPMYDEAPDLGLFSSTRMRSFHKGEIVSVERDLLPEDEWIDGELIHYQESLPAEKIIILTKRNRKLAQLFSRKMAETRRLEDSLREAVEDSELASDELPEAETYRDAMSFMRLFSRSQMEAMRCMFLLDSMVAASERYEKMLKKRNRA